MCPGAAAVQSCCRRRGEPLIEINDPGPRRCEHGGTTGGRSGQLHELTGGRRRRAGGAPPVGTTLGLALLVIACFLAGYLLAPISGEEPRPAVGRDRFLLPQPRPVGEFSLSAVDGGGVYDRDRLRGQWTLLYFGYTRCPDVCGPALALLAGLARELRARTPGSTGLEAVFVSVDPERDTPGVLRAYLSTMPGEIVGLAGSARQIAALARELGVMHVPGRPDASGDYLVDHPATILIVDPDAHLRAGFPFPHDEALIRERMGDIMRAFEAGRTG